MKIELTEDEVKDLLAILNEATMTVKLGQTPRIGFVVQRIASQLSPRIVEEEKVDEG
jgi:hypothetical protein